MNQAHSTDNTGSTARLAIIALAAVGLLLGGFYIWANRSQPVSTDMSSQPLVRPAQPIAAAQPLVIETPAELVLDQEEPVASKPLRPIVPAPAMIEASDNQVKLAMADLAPGMEAWVVSDQQIRKWVLAIDNMADGDVPKQYRPLSYPISRFEPEQHGTDPNQQLLMKVEAYKRTDLFVNLLVTIEPEYLAQYYQAWLPLLEKAYQEQGKKDKFDQRFRQAINNVVAVKSLTAIPELKKRGGVIYTFSDQKLEAASDVEKMLWRMGPENSAKVQRYLQKLLVALPVRK